MGRIDAEGIRRLRGRTGAPVMECRRALEEADGDVDEAEKRLRGRGLAVAPRRPRILSPDRWVDCPCPPGLARPVLEDPAGHDFVLSACLRCGKVEAVHVLTDEPHKGHVVPVGNRVVGLSDGTRSWIAEWPRRSGTGWERYAYLPATLRCETVEELEALEARSLRGQRGLDVAGRLRRAGVPDSPPPPDAQPAYVLFLLHTTWTALSLPPDPPEDELRRGLDLLKRYERLIPIVPTDTTAFRILAPHLAHGGLLVADLAGDDPSRQERAVELLARLSAVAGSGSPPADVVVPLLSERLRRLGPEDSRSIHGVLDVLLAYGPRAAAATDALKELRRRCAGRPPGADADPYLDRRIRKVVRALGGPVA